MIKILKTKSSHFFGLLIATSLVAQGCAELHGYLDSAPKPSARVVDARLTDIALDSANLVFAIEVTNPYSVALPLVNLDYALASGGKPFLNGQAKPADSIPAKGSKVVQMPVRVTFVPMFAALQGVRPGAVVPYDSTLALSVDAPVVGTIQLPLKKSGEVPVPAIPGFELSSIQWKSLDFNKAQAVLQLNITNHNDFPLDLSRLSLQLGLAGKSVATTSVDQSTPLPPGVPTALEIPIEFSPRQLGLSAFQVLQGKNGDYTIRGNLAANTRFGPINLPYEKSGTASFGSR